MAVVHLFGETQAGLRCFVIQTSGVTGVFVEYLWKGRNTWSKLDVVTKGVL